MSNLDCGLTPAQTVEEAVRMLHQTIDDPGLRNAALQVVECFRAAAFSGPVPRVPAFTRIPVLVHGGVTGEFRRAFPLSGLALLLFLGIDLLDDIMDGDETPYWRGRPHAETLLLATALVSAVPQAGLASLGAGDGVTARMQAALARGLLVMAGGQRQDLLAIGRDDVEPDEAENTAGAKSGEMTALLALLGAIHAGADPEAETAYADWGRAYGTADQLRSDCFDLLRDPAGSDLRNGTMSFPIACFVESDDPAERARALAMVRAAPHDPAALAALREALHERKVFTIANVTIAWHAAAAHRALDIAAPHEPAGGALRALLDTLPLNAAATPQPSPTHA
jgi:heptaprenyl diphosphate synthase